MKQEETRQIFRKESDPLSDTEPDRARGVYGISVAAELVGTGVQNLRAYEARGLLTPGRTAGALDAIAPTTWTGCAASGISCRPDSTSPESAWS